MSEIRQRQVYWIDFGPQPVPLPRIAIATSVVCLITSNLSRARAAGNVLRKRGEANLSKVSVVNVSQIVTVDKADLVEYSGRLSGTAAAAVCEGLHLLFDRM